MWVFLNDAFLSIVAHRDDPDALLVRARSEGDIERVFPYAEVWTDDAADYRYRAEVHRSVVARTLSERVENLEATNVKASIQEPHRLHAYHDVWSVMSRWGDREDD